MPEAAPVMRAVDPALKTGCKGISANWYGFNAFKELGLVGEIVSGIERGRSAVELRQRTTTPMLSALFNEPCVILQFPSLGLDEVSSTCCNILCPKRLSIHTPTPILSPML